MTLPFERKNSLHMVHTFLRKLMDPKQTPKVPKGVRQQAYWCLRHYPHEYEIERLAERAPDILGDDFEIVTMKRRVKDETKQVSKPISTRRSR